MYVDLLQERFTTGLNISYNIPVKELEDSSNLIIPCGLQLLIENAVKHNIINKENQLNISITLDNKTLIIENNLRPKLGAKPFSLGIGLKNITEQYKDLTKDKIVITKNKNNFIVKLPIIDD